MHTKGPWKLSSGADEWATIWSENSEQIANILPPIANAHLIAAAPELLEALQRARDEINDVDLLEAPPYITEAIRKAKGE